MNLAAIIYDVVTGKPLMVVRDVTPQQLKDPSYNPEGSAQLVMPLNLYAHLLIDVFQPGT